MCDADDDEEGMYEVCVTKEEVTDCVQIELQVIAICKTDQKEFQVSFYIVRYLDSPKVLRV